jgi:hypothetical protein
LLACEFDVVADSPEPLLHLDRLVSRAAQDYPVSRRHRLESRRAEGGGHRVREGGRPDSLQPDARSTARTLFWRMHAVALDALPEFTRIHAGCASWDGRRLVAAGSPHSGKSTLMARLLYEGFEVHCDELVLLRRGEVLPYPRRFFIRRTGATLIPQMVTDPSDTFEWAGWEPGSLAVDPLALGVEWRIESAPADVVLLLELDDGGQTRLDACPKHVMAERLMFQSSAPAGGPGEWAKDVCAMLDRAECFVLRSGNLDGSVAAVKGLLG